ncbi:aldo/keto reductase [Promicromonospora sukumoe]
MSGAPTGPVPGITDRALGTTGLRVPALVLGTAGLGRKVDEPTAAEVLRAAAAAGWRTWDTSNEYGDAEARVGSALAGLGALDGADGPGGADGPDGAVQVFTKADPLPGSADFSGDRVRASVAESLERLRLDRLPLVHLHDPERISFEDAMAPDGPVRALLDLRDAGTIEHLGVAGGPIGLLRRYVRTGEFEAVVTHNRLTLLDRSAETLLEDCAERGIGVLNAAPFGGGALADDDGPVRSYHYRDADAAQRDAVLRIREIARAAGVPVGALAVRASVRDPRVAATIVGVSSTAQLAQVTAWAATPVPDDVWPDLDAALPDPAHWAGELGR